MFPRWLSWLVIGLFGYVLLFQGTRTQPPALPRADIVPVAQAPAPLAPEQAPAENTSENSVKTIAQAVDVERWKRAINPDYAKKIQCQFAVPEEKAPSLQWKVTEDKAGTGSAAHCSDTIYVNLTVWNSRGEVAYRTPQPLELLIGARQIAAGLDAALMGIKEGGERTVMLPPAALTRDAKGELAKPLAAALGKNNVVIVTVQRLADQ